ncbi:MAG: cyclic nucleotide-binding domain-containing protein [Exilibacterium sp.]
MTEQVPRDPLMEVDRALEIMDKISLFGGLSELQLYTVFKHLKKVSYKAQQIIFKQGDKPSYIYIVLSGAVRLVFDYAHHPLSKIEFLPGACFGETSLIGIQAHSATTVAVVDSELMVLSKESLMSIFDTDKELFGLLVLNIAREASRRLHRTDELLQRCLQHPALEQVTPELLDDVAPDALVPEVHTSHMSTHTPDRR